MSKKSSYEKALFRNSNNEVFKIFTQINNRIILKKERNKYVFRFPRSKVESESFTCTIWTKDNYSWYNLRDRVINLLGLKKVIEWYSIGIYSFPGCN